MLYFIHISKFFLDANVPSFMDSAAVTDPQYATIDQLHEVVPVSEVSKRIPKILPVTVEDLGKYVLDCHNNGDEELKNQYQVLGYCDGILAMLLTCALYCTYTVII